MINKWKSGIGKVVLGGSLVLGIISGVGGIVFAEEEGKVTDFCGIEVENIHTDDSEIVKKYKPQLEWDEGMYVSDEEMQEEANYVVRYLVENDVDVDPIVGGDINVYRTSERWRGINGFHIGSYSGKPGSDIVLSGKGYVVDNVKESRTFTHEYIHYLAGKFLDYRDWEEYKEIRGLGEEFKLYNEDWGYKLSEVFAEDMVEIMVEGYEGRTDDPEMSDREKKEVSEWFVKKMKDSVGEKKDQKPYEECVGIEEETGDGNKGKEVDIDEEVVMSVEDWKRDVWNGKDELEKIEDIKEWMGYKKGNDFNRGETAYSLGLMSEGYRVYVDYEDVGVDDKWRHKIEKAVGEGWIRGFSREYFGYKEKLTRAQAMVLLSRMFDLEDKEEKVEFKDRSDVGYSLDEGVGKMIANGYVKGDNGYIYPDREVSRREWFRMVVRLWEENDLQIDEDWMRKDLNKERG